MIDKLDSSLQLVLNSIQLRMLPEMFRALVERPETLEDGKKGISAIPSICD